MIPSLSELGDLDEFPKEPRYLFLDLDEPFEDTQIYGVDELASVASERRQ